MRAPYCPVQAAPRGMHDTRHYRCWRGGDRGGHCVPAGALRRAAVKRTTENKSPAIHKQEFLDGMHDGYQKIVSDTLRTALYTPASLFNVCPTHNLELAGDNAKILFPLAMHLISDWSMRTVPTYVTYPNYGVVVLQANPEDAKLGIEEVADHWDLQQNLRQLP